jgi:ferredoxin--NADP+ reductase
MPIAKALFLKGAEVTSIIGFRTKELVILEEEFASCSSRLFVTTDDGSYARPGMVTEPLAELLGSGEEFDMIFVIGPLRMMQAVTLTAKPYGTPVTVSMNPIMIDGTGMCGGCRLTTEKDGVRKTRFACVDGPDFNGYEIDFDEAMSRGAMYRDFERHAYEEACNLFQKEVS